VNNTLWKIVFLLCAVACASCVFAQGPGGLKNGERPLSKDTVKIIGGNGSYYAGYQTKTVTIAGRLYDGNYVVITGDGKWMSFDIRGWDHFVTYLGIKDDDRGKSATVTIEVDGDVIVKKTVRHGDDAVSLDIPLTGGSALSMRWDGYPCFASPKLIKGDPAPQFACKVCGQQFLSQQMLIGHINAAHGAVAAPPTPAGFAPPLQAQALFVVDPSDLDKLAGNLRKQVDAKPAVKTLVDTAQIAVMTFNLIDVPSPSVARNVAEDLTTSLMKNDFQTVERGQLDKQLQELKIQDSGLIDPATAQKIHNGTGCNVIIVGSISDRGQFIVINARLLDTSTGKTIAAERVECRKIEIKR
jgi:TolB-like protein